MAGATGRPRQRPDRLLADKAHPSRVNRAWLRERGIATTIPERDDQIAHRRKLPGRPIDFDDEQRQRYRGRNVVERCFNKLEWRGLAMRSDKTARNTEGMSTAPLREAARVIVLDDDQRVLLLHYAEIGGFWATPGGSLEEDEDHACAARRELNEELGVAEKDVKLSAQLAERSQNHAVGGREVHQVEQYFLTHLTPADIDPANATQTDNIRAHRWWTLKELRTTHQTVYPVGLADLITNFLDHGMPDQPVILH